MATDRRRAATFFRCMALLAAAGTLVGLGEAIWFLSDPIAPVIFSAAALCALSAWSSWRIAKTLNRQVAEAVSPRPRRSLPRLLAVHAVVLAIFLSLPVTIAIAFGWRAAALVYGFSLSASVCYLVVLKAAVRRRARP
jgi:hypothetical protein